MLKAILFMIFLFSSCPSSAANIQKHRFMPENELSEFDNLDIQANITEDQFEAVLAKIEAYYKPLLQSLYGVTFQVTRDWKDSTVNAYATQSDDVWEIHMYGGLARRAEITPDGFALVACHETGHHLGGFPNIDWAANEGQADYFSTLSCARHLWKGDAKNAESVKKISAYPKQKCDSVWKSAQDRALCYRIALAGKSLADLLSNKTAKFETPDLSQVSETDNEHPMGQCRLDTYLAGALCKKVFDDHNIPQSEEEAAEVSCMQSRKEIGFRPRCWFKPSL